MVDRSVCSVSLEILQSWGVGSGRNASGFPVPTPAGGLTDPATSGDSRDTEYLYDIPLGPSIIRWDLASQERLMQFQAHPDLVTCARKSPDQTMIASSSYSGGVKVWSSKWVCLASSTAPMESQFHLAWSRDSKLFLAIGNGRDSSLAVYSISKEESAVTLTRLWVLRAMDCPSSVADGEHTQQDPATSAGRDSEGHTSASHNPAKHYPGEKAFYMAEFNPSGNIFAVEEVPYRTTLVHLVSPEGKVVRSMDLMAGVGNQESRPVNSLFISAYHDGTYAISLEGGRVVLMDAELLQLKKTFKVGSGFRAAVWDGDALVLPSDNGKVAWWSQDGDKMVEFESFIQDYVVRMDWSASGEGLWLCGFSCLLYLAVERNKAGVVKSLAPSFAVHCHELTSVGVGFDPSGQLVGSGDMVGTVWVTEKDKVVPTHKFTVNGSVRCLTWVDGERMLVGTLDGGIHWWGTRESQPHPLIHQQGSIIHMQFNRERKLLAVGTTKGMLCVYDIQVTSGGGVRYDTVVEMNAHPPQHGPQDQRFGQLGKQAEIWSLCWSPDEAKLATCSEDQTLKVWATDSWKCLATLRGHSLAVTSVDWVQFGQWNLLVSCSDDRTVRLRNGETFELICTVNTEDIDGWHTLTYLSFYPHRGGYLLLCTTQNGHLVVWTVLQDPNGDSSHHHQQQALQPTNSSQQQTDRTSPDDHPSLCRVWNSKLHLGSVEGLAWQHVVDGGSVATVGGDCTVNLFKLCL